MRGSTDQDSRLSWNTTELQRTPVTVKFSVNSDDDENNSFVRTNTPHPKDLKARHPKLFPTPEAPVVTPTPIPAQPHPTINVPVATEPITSTTYATSSIAQRAQAAPVSPQNPTSKPQNNYASPIYANVKKSADTSTRPKVSVSISKVSDSCSSGGDEKHVGFNDSDNDSEVDINETETKLRRRDTPHHLKNKRIQGSTSSSTTAGDTTTTATTTATASSTASDKQRVTDILAKAAAANAATSAVTFSQRHQTDQHDYENTEDLYHEYTILITRSVGQGLGISIAGGKGSPAYIGEDEVCS